MALFFIRLKIEQFKHIEPKTIQLNESLISIIGLRDFCEQSILMEVFAFVFGDKALQIQNANVIAEFREFSVRCQRVNGQSHYYYGRIFGDMHELATHTQYCERLLIHGINCGTQSFLISVPLLDQYSANGLDLRRMLEPALTRSLDLLTDQKEIVTKHCTDQNMKEKWTAIEHIYYVVRQFFLAMQEFQQMLKDGFEKIRHDALLLQLTYRRQQIIKTNEFLEDGREHILVSNAEGAFFEYPERASIHSNALKGYLLGVTDLSWGNHSSDYMTGRIRINEDNLYALNEIDDNIRAAIIQNYDNDLDLEQAEVIAKLLNFKDEKIYLEGKIAIDAKPVYSMEIWIKRLRAMSKNLKSHETNAIVSRKKVSKRETVFEQQEWFSCANEPTTIMLANDVGNRAVDVEYGVHHMLFHIDADMPPEFEEGNYNGAVCMREKHDNIIISDDLSVPDIDYAKFHCFDDSVEMGAIFFEHFGIVDATNRKMKQKFYQIMIDILNHLDELIKDSKTNEIIKKHNEDVRKLEVMAETLALKHWLNDPWYQKSVIGTVYRKFPLSAEHIIWSIREGKTWDNVLRAEMQTIKENRDKIVADQTEIDCIMDDLENEIQIQNISSMFEEQTEFYNVISDSITKLKNKRMNQLYKWYLIRNESLMKHIQMELQIDHYRIFDIDWDPNQYIQHVSSNIQQFEMDELKTIVIRLQKHWFHVSKHPKIFQFVANDYYNQIKLKQNRCNNDIKKTSKLFKNRCHKFQKPFEHFQKICYDEVGKMDFLHEIDIVADRPAFRYPIEIITNNPKRDEAFTFTKWNTYFTAFWIRLFLNLAIKTPFIICDSFDYYLTWHQRNQVYRFLRRVALERHIQIVLMSRKSVEILQHDEVFLMWHTNANRNQIEMASVSNLIEVEEVEHMEGIEEL